jgi:hypothetical protein
MREVAPVPAAAAERRQEMQFHVDDRLAPEELADFGEVVATTRAAIDM